MLLLACWLHSCLAQVCWPGCSSDYASAFIPCLLCILHVHAASAPLLLYVKHTWCQICRLRLRVPHQVPDRLKLVGELQQLVLDFLNVTDPSNGAMLISHTCLKTICIQIEHALSGKLSGQSVFLNALPADLKSVHHFELSLICTLCQHDVSSIVMTAM